jgi:hypothetical protein
MSVFIGTLFIVGLSCLAMALGQIIDGKPLSGGCGSKPKGSPRCASCPKRKIKSEIEDKS